MSPWLIVALRLAGVSVVFTTGCQHIASAPQLADTAQAIAPTTLAVAQDDFGKQLDTYRQSVTTKLDGIDQKINTLEATTKRTTGVANADGEAKLVRVRAKRQEIASDYQALDGASASTWEDAKGPLDQALTALDKLIQYF